MTDPTQKSKMTVALVVSALLITSLVGVGAVSTVGAAPLESADRTVTETATPGETVTVTVSGQLTEETQALTITESFGPEFVNVEFQSLTVDGQNVDPLDLTLVNFNNDGYEVFYDGEGEAIGSSSFELVYTVEVVNEEATHNLTGGSVIATDLNNESESINFESTSIDVVDPVQLHLNANQTTLNASESIRFTVTENNSGEPVDNATVIFDNADAVTTTGTDGTATFSFQGAGEVSATATKPATNSQVFVDSMSVNISVDPDPEDTTSKYREPETGDIEVDGLREGIDDFTSGEADLDVLRQLIEGFTSR